MREGPRLHQSGFDYHDKSIEGARESAKLAGIADRHNWLGERARAMPLRLGYNRVT
jgi:hypothetical protein